jgi:O-antigen ligase/tetratricopeptide (TPR) repeat protein
MGGYIDVTTTADRSGLGGIFGYSACTTAHGILYALISGAAILAIARKQVAQFPHLSILAALSCAIAFIAFSVGISSYRMQSLITFSDWVMYAVVFMTACAVAGRQTGPKILCGAFVAGCSVTAFGAVFEFITQPDPTWRVMFHWQDPNALAGILVLGFFVAIGLGFASTRLTAIAFGLAAGLIGNSILLTLSKGGLLGVLAGGLALFIFLGAYTRTRLGLKLAYLAAPFVLAILIFSGVHKVQSSLATPSQTASTAPASSVAARVPAPDPLGRVLNPMSTAEQSAGFRINLWKGCLSLIKDNPVGYGIGTYRYQSAKPGNTTETKLAHNSFLQLAVESSPAATVALIVFLVLCAYEMLKGSRCLPEKPNMLRAGIFAAVLAGAIHNCLDSDLYFCGTGIGIFLLIGLGLAISSDAIVPELLRPPVRAVVLGGTALGTLITLYAGVLQIKLEAFLADVGAQSSDGPSEALALQGYGPMDYRVWFYSTSAATTADQAIDWTKKSIELGPTVVAYHRLATFYRRTNQPDKAISALKDSLNLDPNNLAALQLICEIQQESAPSDALKTAQRMVDIEKSPYFSTRALPEVVPTETYEAREYLAQNVKGQAAINLLRPALEGFVNYATTTVPMIVRFSADGGSNQFGNPKDAVNKLSLAITNARNLSAYYRAEGDEKDAKWVDQAERTLESAVGELGTPATSSK